MILGKRLKALRKERGLTQQELGDMINVTKVSICCYEKGTRTPTLDTLMDLTKVFNVDVNYFLGSDTYVVSDSDENYGIRMAKEEIEIIRELRLHINLYERLIEDPKRMVDFIDKKVR